MKRQIEKEFYGDKITHKLNSATPSPSVFRIRTLIERLQAYSEKLAHLESFCRERKLMRSDGAALFTIWPFGHYKLTDPDVSLFAAQIVNIEDEIRLTLHRYHWRPDVRIGPDGTLEPVTRFAQFDKEAAWESEMAQWLFSQLPIVPQDRKPFANFLHCERCGDWFYAGREGSKFCKDACRVMSHVQTDEGKASRARYMRDHRKKKRERERKKAEARSKTSANTKQKKVRI